MSPRSTRLLVRPRVAAVLAGAVAAGVLWLLAVPVGGVDLRVTTPGQQSMEVGPLVVVVAAVIGSGVGWAALELCERFFDRARTLWLVLVVVVLVLTGVNAATAANNGPAAVWLNLMHLAVAVVVVPVLTRTSARR